MRWINASEAPAGPLRPRAYALGGPLLPHRPPEGEDVNPVCGHFWPNQCDGCGVCTTCDGCYCRAAERD